MLDRQKEDKNASESLRLLKVKSKQMKKNMAKIARIPLRPIEYCICQACQLLVNSVMRANK